MDVSFVFHKCQGINGNDKGLLVSKPVAPGPDKYVSLKLNLIRCRDFYRYTSGIMRCIEDNTNALGMIQVTRLLGLRLRLR